MAKNEPRTMRFASDVEAYINSQLGDNFSEKFHNLVRKFKDEEVKKEHQLSLLDIEIAKREKRLRELNDFLGGQSWIEINFRNLETSINNCRKVLEKVSNTK